jgi:hypothetical protein
MLPSAMSRSWDPDDPRLRRKAVPGESSVDRLCRRAQEGPKRRDWADRILRPEPDEPPPAPEEEAHRSQPSDDIGNASSRGHETNNNGHAASYRDRGDDFAPTTLAEIEAAERARRAARPASQQGGLHRGDPGPPPTNANDLINYEAARRADRRAEAAHQREVHGTVQHEVHGVKVGKRGHVLAGLDPRSRKPGGRFRAGQRAPGRNPPAPSIPVSPAIIERVLGLGWRTPSGWVNLYRRRALAAIAVALALPPESSTMTKLCALRYHDLVMLDLRMPAIGWRHVYAWLRVRGDMLGPAVASNSSWLAIPPGTNGKPRMIGWAMTQTLHRGGAPAWRSRELIRASWSPHVTTMTWSEASRLRGA